MNYIGEIEINDGIYTIMHDIESETLLAGFVFNAGFAPIYSHAIDSCFTLDENLQEFIETIEHNYDHNTW